MPKPAKSKKAVRRRGRPPKGTEEDSLIRILDAASTSFLTAGYAATSIDGVSATAGVSKTTFYSRFSNKAELFTAVAQRWIAHDPAPPIEVSYDLPVRERLHSIAIAMLKRVLSPEMVAWDRIISAEASRFPELVRIREEFGQIYGIRALEECLAAGVERGELDLTDIAFATNQLLTITIRDPLRKAVLGIDDPRFMPKHKEYLARAIDLFLNGAVPRKR